MNETRTFLAELEFIICINIVQSLFNLTTKNVQIDIFFVIPWITYQSATKYTNAFIKFWFKDVHWF